MTLVLDVTPFYAESGGQVGDTGYITNDNFKMQVNDCRKTSDGKYLHIGKVVSGSVQTGDKVTATIDIERRKATARNHTVTHLLHKALRNVLGDHVHQAGSLVTPERLRFDFTHFSAMTPEQLDAVESEVNARILENLPVDIREMPMDEAKKLGHRTVWRKVWRYRPCCSCRRLQQELCGGTHLTATAEAGLIKYWVKAEYLQV